MNALLKADLAALEGTHRKLEGSIGTQRLRAAEKAFAAKLSPSTTATSATVAAPSPDPVVAEALSGSASEQASIDQTLALARAAGVGRFAVMQEGATAPPSDDGGDTLALAREAGIGRYGQ